MSLSWLDHAPRHGVAGPRIAAPDYLKVPVDNMRGVAVIGGLTRKGCVGLSLVLVMVGHGDGDRLRRSGREVAVEAGAGYPGFGDDVGDGVPGVA